MKKKINNNDNNIIIINNNNNNYNNNNNNNNNNNCLNLWCMFRCLMLIKLKSIHVQIHVLYMNTHNVEYMDQSSVCTSKWQQSQPENDL